jgi:hypothetical protein
MVYFIIYKIQFKFSFDLIFKIEKLKKPKNINLKTNGEALKEKN